MRALDKWRLILMGANIEPPPEPPPPEILEELIERARVDPRIAALLKRLGIKPEKIVMHERRSVKELAPELRRMAHRLLKEIHARATAAAEKGWAVGRVGGRSQARREARETLYNVRQHSSETLYTPRMSTRDNLAVNRATEIAHTTTITPRVHIIL